MMQNSQRINKIYMLKNFKKEFQASLGYQVNSRSTNFGNKVQSFTK